MAFTTRPTLRGDLGMVASSHWAASAAGMAVLERGGTAADAAAAAGFVLQVVLPDLNGPGGDLPVLVQRSDGEVRVVCGQGAAPAGASPEAFERLGLPHVPGDGLLAAATPGAFGAWIRLLQEMGTLPLADVLDSAVGYAENGFPASGPTVETITDVAGVLTESWPESGATWLPGGRAPQPGQRLRNPALATTYRRILALAAEAGSDREKQLDAADRAWHEGFVAEAIDGFGRRARPDSTGTPHTAFLTGDDLAGTRATIEPAVCADYGGMRVHKAGPWTQGPVFLQQLALLAGSGLEDMEVGGAEYVHTVIESAKLALADRDAWYGDPGFVPDLVPELLADGYVAARRALVTGTASTELRPGAPGGRTPRSPRPQAGAWAPGHGARRWGAPGDTVHLDVVDRWGTLVSATPSRGWLQSSPIVPELGFALSTSTQMFTLEPGLANSLAPGKRPRSTLSPTIAQGPDGMRIAFGTPGGDLQDQWSLVFFLRWLHGGRDLQEAVDAPMFHTGHFIGSFFPHTSHPGVLAIEESAGPDVAAELTRRGHYVRVRPAWSLGRICAVATDGEFCSAAASPRGSTAYAAGR